jgi:hypothetical protein
LDRCLYLLYLLLEASFHLIRWIKKFFFLIVIKFNRYQTLKLLFRFIFWPYLIFTSFYQNMILLVFLFYMTIPIFTWLFQYYNFTSLVHIYLCLMDALDVVVTLLNHLSVDQDELIADLEDIL